MQVPKTEKAAILIWGTLTGVDHILVSWQSVLFFGKELTFFNVDPATVMSKLVGEAE
jgi:hypothetical protein